MLDHEPGRACHNSAFVTVLWAALACASALSRAPARAQDEIDEAPSKTLEDHSERERLGPEKTDKKARELFEKGREAWDEGRFREAWEHWHHSYRLSRRPELLYNVGQAADRLRMDREALEAFRLYLEKNPNASNRKEVENRIRILEREVDNAPAQERTDYLSEGLGDDAAASSTATSASTEGEPTADYKGEDEVADEGTGKPGRSGLYVRLAASAGVWADSVADTAGNTGSLSSLTLSIDGLVGYGVMPQLAIGGGILLEFALSPTYEGNGGTAIDDVQASLGLLLGFADYYLEADDGWHLFGGLGLGRMAFSGGGLGNENAGGGALFAGVGYDFPFDESLSFGVSGRLLIGRFSQDIADHTLVAPAVTASALWF